MNFALNSGPSFGPLPFLLPLWVVGVWAVTAIVHIGFALAVYLDSQRMDQEQKRETFLVGGGLWALAVLLGGVVAAGIYWAVHHSTLRPAGSSERPL